MPADFEFLNIIGWQEVGVEQSKIDTHQLDNGLILVAEHMPAVASAAFTFLLPSGAKHDPASGSGCSVVLLDWVFRGAGSRDSRQLDGFLDGAVHFSGCIYSQRLGSALHT